MIFLKPTFWLHAPASWALQCYENVSDQFFIRVLPVDCDVSTYEFLP